MTKDKIQIPPSIVAAPTIPEFVRLPKPGHQCPWTGLSRSAINQWILATADNNGKPPVRSFVIRKRGARTGIRVVDYSSLRAFILRHQEAA